MNFGYTSGLPGQKFLNIDFTKYTKVRAYATIINNDAIFEMDLTKRVKTAVSKIVASSSAPRIWLSFGINIVASKTRIQALGYSMWSWNPTDAVLSVEYGASRDDIYVHRIEGIV